MNNLHKIILTSLGFYCFSIQSFSAQSSRVEKYKNKIFTQQRFSKLICAEGLNRIEIKSNNGSEIACQDSLGKLQGIAIRMNVRGLKERAHIYQNSQLTDQRTVVWDETGKISYTEEPNIRITWYNFKKKKKHLETILTDGGKETREWFPSGKLQSLLIEKNGLPPNVVSWDEKGNKIQ